MPPKTRREYVVAHVDRCASAHVHATSKPIDEDVAANAHEQNHANVNLEGREARDAAVRCKPNMAACMSADWNVHAAAISYVCLARHLRCIAFDSFVSPAVESRSGRRAYRVREMRVPSALRGVARRCEAPQFCEALRRPRWEAPQRATCMSSMV